MCMETCMVVFVCYCVCRFIPEIKGDEEATSRSGSGDPVYTL